VSAVAVAGSGVSVAGTGVDSAGTAPGIAFAFAVAVAIGISVVGVERAHSRGGAGGIVGVEGTRSIGVDGVIAICTVAVETQGWPGVHEVGSASSSNIEVEGVLLVFKRKTLRLIGAFQVAMKNGRKVVGWTQ